MDNINQVVKDVKYLIATDCSNETVKARIENYISERDMYKLADFQFWQLDKGYLDREKVKNGMVDEYLKDHSS